MEEQYIDLRHSAEHLERTRARFMADPSVSDKNKELIESFLRDAAIGKTVIGRARKKIGPSTRITYIQHLRILIDFLELDLDALSEPDMERFIEALESDKIGSRNQRIFGKTPYERGVPLSTRYKVNIKKTIKKFYKWLQGESKRYPKLVEWIDTYAEPKEIAALSEAEVARMVDRARTPVVRALVQVLFDGGFRIGEILNVRLRHLRLVPLGSSGESCFVMRIVYSKTLRRTVALPMSQTTRWLRAWLEEHPAGVVVEQDGTISAQDDSAQPFPMTDNAARTAVSRLGMAVLAKRVYPHLLRHSSATYWSNRLGYFKLCKRFGWTMTSSMPQRYIDREGVDELEMAKAHVEAERSRVNGSTDEMRAELAENATLAEAQSKLASQLPAPLARR